MRGGVRIWGYSSSYDYFKVWRGEGRVRLLKLGGKIVV